MLEATYLFPTNGVQSAAPLVDIRKALENERDEKRDKDIHAENVPRNEKCTSPALAATVALKKFVGICAIGRHHSRKVFHNLIPALSTTHSEEENQRLGHRSKINVVVFSLSEFSKAKDLSEGDGIYKKQDKPSCQQVED